MIIPILPTTTSYFIKSPPECQISYSFLLILKYLFIFIIPFFLILRMINEFPTYLSPIIVIVIKCFLAFSLFSHACCLVSRLHIGEILYYHSIYCRAVGIGSVRVRLLWDWYVCLYILDVFITFILFYAMLCSECYYTGCFLILFSLILYYIYLFDSASVGVVTKILRGCV